MTTPAQGIQFSMGESLEPKGWVDRFFDWADRMQRAINGDPKDQVIGTDDRVIISQPNFDVDLGSPLQTYVPLTTILRSSDVNGSNSIDRGNQDQK